MKAKNAIVGTTVKIKRSSKWYREGGVSNPIGTTGKVISFNPEDADAGEFCIRVEWSNGWKNCYRLIDLKVVKG